MSILKMFLVSHADFTYEQKFGRRDYRGEEIRKRDAQLGNCRRFGKNICSQNIEVKAYVSSVGEIGYNRCFQDLDLSKIDESINRCPDKETAEKMIEKISEVKKMGILLEEPSLV